MSTIFTFPRLFFCHNFRKQFPKKKPCESPSPSKRYVFFSATQGGSSARSDWFTHSLSKASSRRGCLSRKTVRVAKLRLWPSFCGCLWQLLFQKIVEEKKCNSRVCSSLISMPFIFVKSWRKWFQWAKMVVRRYTSRKSHIVRLRKQQQKTYRRKFPRQIDRWGNTSKKSN